MGNVGRHTWISSNNNKNTLEMLVGTPGSLQIMTKYKDIGNIGKHLPMFLVIIE